MATKQEVFVRSDLNPNLREHEFDCNGSDSENFPANLGMKTVGLKIAYSTWAEDRTIVEDHTHLKGCINFDNGKCAIGEKPCPVASVVDIKEFRGRMAELRKLKTF